MDYKIITYQKDNGDYIAYYKHLPLLQTGIGSTESDAISDLEHKRKYN